MSNIKFKVSQTISLQLPRLVQQVPAHTPILPSPGEHRRHHHCHHHLHHHDLQVSLGNLTTTFHQHDHHHCQKKTFFRRKRESTCRKSRWVSNSSSLSSYKVVAVMVMIFSTSGVTTRLKRPSATDLSGVGGAEVVFLSISDFSSFHKFAY